MGRAGRPTRFPKIKRVGGRGGRRKTTKQVSVVLGRSVASSTRAPPPRRTVIPSLDPITRRRGRGLSDIPRPRPRPRPVALPPRLRPRPPVFTGGSDFNILQPFGRPTTTRDRRPSRVTVQSPSERRDKLITVSSRSRLARERRTKGKRATRKESRVGFGKRTAFVKGRGARRDVGKLTTPRKIRVPRNGTPIIGTATIGRERFPRSRQGGVVQVTQFIDRARPTQRRVSIPFREPIPFMPFQESIREEEEERPRRRGRASPRRRSQVQSDFDLGNIFDVQF